jgi:hypothetical protein
MTKAFLLQDASVEEHEEDDCTPSMIREPNGNADSSPFNAKEQRYAKAAKEDGN